MSVRISVKVVPSASRDGIAGWLGDELKIRVSAPPEKGKANKAVEMVLAKALGLSSKEVSVVAGKTNPRKTVELMGIDEKVLYQQLSAHLST